MNKQQVLLVLAAALVVVGLFQLPRSVVENEQVQDVEMAQSHSMEIPQEVENQLDELRRFVQDEESIDKKINFAHSLAHRFLDYGRLDSAAGYAERIREWDIQPSYRVADIYFTAFQRASDQAQAEAFAAKAKEELQKLLDKDPADLSVKNRLAMTLVVSENPMAGVALLREVLSEDETNRQALLNLGLLAIQSGQFERARERFEKLTSLNAADYEAKLYLAVSLMEIQQQSQARLLLEEILASSDSIPAIKMMANDYLRGL